MPKAKRKRQRCEEAENEVSEAAAVATIERLSKKYIPKVSLHVVSWYNIIMSLCFENPHTHVLLTHTEQVTQCE